MCITEASYTLLLYDELLEWSDRPLREFLNYPMQSEWQRKEYLHLTIIQNFDRGKVSRDILTLPPLASITLLSTFTTLLFLQLPYLYFDLFIFATFWERFSGLDENYHHGSLPTSHTCTFE